MIIGHGDIASVLTDREDRVYFASGVSNSQEKRRSEYEREKKLLLQQDPHRHLVYFSSLCIFYTDTLYAQHKVRMEKLIKETFKHYTIIRLGNIDWGTNPNTLINYLRAHPDSDLLDAYRYIVDEDEFLYWVSMIPSWPCEMNIPGQRMKVVEVWRKYVARKDSKEV